MDELIAEIDALSRYQRFAEAMAKVTEGLARYPGDAGLLYARSTLLLDWGRQREARDGFLQAQRAGLDHHALYLNLAWCNYFLGSPEIAERNVRDAVRVDPGSTPSQFCLGVILIALNRHAEAAEVFTAIPTSAAERAAVLANITFSRIALGQYSEAEASARLDIALAPEVASHWVNLGTALVPQDRIADALDALRCACDISSASSDDAIGFVSYSYWLLWSGQPWTAVQFCREKLPLHPLPLLHTNYALALLTTGQFREGWTQNEFRWFTAALEANHRQAARPAWAGQALAGKTLVLRGEQGAGDTIQFARYAAVFKSMGASVVMQVQPELLKLAQGFAGVDRVNAQLEPDPAAHYCLWMMSAPHALGTEVVTVPADVPYLDVNADLKRIWADRLPRNGLKVGFAWAGSPAHLRDRHRSMPLDQLRVLWSVAGTSFISLQKVRNVDEADQLTSAGILDVGPLLDDFVDTAAVIAGLDLVICVDTAIAHLAGALGKPVWLMVPEAADFRWLRERLDSPWYPTMRLFRQRVLGQWDDVVMSVQDALEQAVQSGSVGMELGPPRSSIENRGAEVRLTEFAKAVENSSNAGPPITCVVQARCGVVQYVPDADDVARSVAWYGEYLQPHLDLLARVIRPGSVVLEAGSGIGVHAIALARMVGANGHLVMYEHSLLTRRILLQNLDANRMTRGNTLMRQIVGARSALTRMRVDLRGVEDASQATSESEPFESVDDLVLESLDVLKVLQADAMDVIEGADATLWRLRPVLFLVAKSAEAVSALAIRAGAYGYRCWRVETAVFQTTNFNQRDTDIFKGQVVHALFATPEERGAVFDFPGCTELTTIVGDGGLDRGVQVVATDSAGGGSSADRPKAGLFARFRKLIS